MTWIWGTRESLHLTTWKILETQSSLLFPPRWQWTLSTFITAPEEDPGQWVQGSWAQNWAQRNVELIHVYFSGTTAVATCYMEIKISILSKQTSLLLFQCILFLVFLPLQLYWFILHDSLYLKSSHREGLFGQAVCLLCFSVFRPCPMKPRLPPKVSLTLIPSPHVSSAGLPGVCHHTQCV